MQRGFARIWWTDQADLCRTFVTHCMRGMTVRRSCMRSADLLGQLPDAGLNVRLQMLRPLVSRNCAQHLFQAVKTLARFACHAEGLLGPLELRREVGRHLHKIIALSTPRTFYGPRN